MDIPSNITAPVRDKDIRPQTVTLSIKEAAKAKREMRKQKRLKFGM